MKHAKINDDHVHEKTLTPELQTEILQEHVLPFGATQEKGIRVLPPKKNVVKIADITCTSTS